jgi:signal transduction histidine kinase/CheY-like chemotaxis protein
VIKKAYPAERALILAPHGRDARIAAQILVEARIDAHVCPKLASLLEQLTAGADVAILTEESVSDLETRPLREWVDSQPTLSDFPFVLLTRHGGGLERNPTAVSLTGIFGNVTFLERPFHPTTLVSVVQTALRGRRRQYECSRLNDELEARVQERTEELAAANRELLSQIEERERVESTLRQMQRLEAVGQLTSGVAHDFNNLLTVLLGNIRFLERSLIDKGLDGKVVQRLSNMREAAQRGARLTDQLLTFSRRQHLEPVATDLNAVLSKVEDLLQSTIGRKIKVETLVSGESCLAMVDQTQLQLAILNLAINARDAMGNGGSLCVSTRNVVLAPPNAPEKPPAGKYVEICVSDTGHGMSKEVRAKAFEPFFTTKDVGKGSGLGLSQVLGFAKQSGGGVCVQTEEGKGTAICIYLPPAQGVATVLQSEATMLVAAPHSGAVILLVDDDNAVRDVTATYLRELGYQVLEAGSGGAALEVLGSSAAVDLLLLDYAMPGMNGAELSRRARGRRPLLPVLFVTGFAEQDAFKDISERDIVRKPINVQELSTKLRASLASRPRQLAEQGMPA